jgi:hypothetical protein
LGDFLNIRKLRFDYWADFFCALPPTLRQNTFENASTFGWEGILAGLLFNRTFESDPLAEAKRIWKAFCRRFWFYKMDLCRNSIQSKSEFRERSSNWKRKEWIITNQKKISFFRIDVPVVAYKKI